MIAADVAIAGSGRLQDRGGAVSAVADTWYGKVLIFLVAIGLAGYAAWRFAQGVLGRPLEGGKKEGWPKRIGYFARSGWYLFLLWVVLAALAGADEESGSREGPRDGPRPGLAARTVDRGAVGLAILGAGVFNYWRGITQSFKKKLKLRKMSELEEKVFTIIGMVGHIARGTVFGLIGFFLMRAAWQYDPKEAVGLDGALSKILQEDYGDTMLGIVSAGLIAYGLYCFVEARYREV